jgi:hypothetical protein
MPQSSQSTQSGKSNRSNQITTDRREIQRWAEKHGGHPARVKGTGRGQDPGILRLDFPGFSGEGKLEPIEWDRFFRWFEANGLALIYRDKDRFNKIVSRDTVAERLRGPRTASARPRAKTAQPRARAGGASARAQRGKRAPNGQQTSSTASGRTRATTKRSTPKRSTAKHSTPKRSTAKR